MKITIRLFAGAAQQAGVRAIDVELRDGATVAEARDHLLTLYPQLKALSAISLWANQNELLDVSAMLPADSELAMIPPVSGG